MMVDPKIDPQMQSKLEKDYGKIKYCCKCHKVLGVCPTSTPYYYYEGEGFYCCGCKDIHKEKR